MSRESLYSSNVKRRERPTEGKVMRGVGNMIQRHNENDAEERKAAEKARMEKAKAKVEARRKAGSSLAHLNKLRYGEDLG